MREELSDDRSETESGLPDAAAIAQYISQNYSFSSKIIEVCAGNYLQIAFEIKKNLPETKVVVMDITSDFIDFVEKNAPGLIPIVDDISKPNKNSYRGASLIYAIRPPVELQPMIARLAEEVGADLIFRTLSDEYPPLIKSKQKLLVNTGNALLHIYKW